MNQSNTPSSKNNKSYDNQINQSISNNQFTPLHNTNLNNNIIIDDEVNKDGSNAYSTAQNVN